jgi:hypothetical protein
MKRVLFFGVLIVLISGVLNGQNNVGEDLFESASRSADWRLAFQDTGTKSWHKKWFLDGLRADIENTKEGMIFSAGPVEGDDACHAVLWTKKSFKGDVKIEYEYTRTDTRKSQVNILYIQATGVAPFNRDIFRWNNDRIIPAMRTYFNNMQCLHISYAAFDKNGKSYIRARKYPLLPGRDFNTSTEISPAYFNTDMFMPGESYKITVIKRDGKLFFYVNGQKRSRLCVWDITDANDVLEGRIGFRHMYTRSARYRNIRIYELNSSVMKSK